MMKTILQDGIIRVGGAAPEKWGFTLERFTGDSYLWKIGDSIYISFIESRKKQAGFFSYLVKAIKADGFLVKVPTPLGMMTLILQKWGFIKSIEGDCEVWTNP